MKDILLNRKFLSLFTFLTTIQVSAQAAPIIYDEPANNEFFFLQYGIHGPIVATEDNHSPDMITPGENWDTSVNF